MSTATYEIVKQVNKNLSQGGDPFFSIAYLPMNTPDFQLSNGDKLASIRIAIFMTFLGTLYHVPKYLA